MVLVAVPEFCGGLWEKREVKANFGEMAEERKREGRGARGDGGGRAGGRVADGDGLTASSPPPAPHPPPRIPPTPRACSPRFCRASVHVARVG